MIVPTSADAVDVEFATAAAYMSLMRSPNSPKQPQARYSKVVSRQEWARAARQNLRSDHPSSGRDSLVFAENC